MCCTFAPFFEKTKNMAKIEEQKTQIFDTATRLFREFGIRRVSIDDICRDLRISKKTFYSYFPQKEDLIRELSKLVYNESVKRFAKIFNGRSAVEALLLIVSKSYEFADNNDNIIREDIEKYYPKIFEEIRELHTALFKSTFEKNIRQGIAEGYYRDDLDVELLLAYNLLYAHSNGIKEIEKMLGRTFSKKRIVQFFNDMFIHIIVNERGMKYFEENYYNKFRT